MSPSREFDLVLFGATGYTGRLIAQHLGSRAGPGISWAVAGRSAGSLRQLGREVGHPAAVLADAADPDSLRAMVRRAKVGRFRRRTVRLARERAREGLR